MPRTPRLFRAVRARGTASALAVLIASCGTITAPPVATLTSSAIGDVSVPVQSVEAKRFDTVVRQRYDFSCGSAALATLLRYHYGRGEDEEAVFRGMWREGDRDQIRKAGFSLLDMKRYLAALGASADGFQVSLDEIETAGVPGIALITVAGYKHFVVIKGIRGQEVLVGDPALGLTVTTRKAFQQGWNGLYFVLDEKPQAKRNNFNTAAHWGSYPRMRASSPFLEPASQQALRLSSPMYRDF